MQEGIIPESGFVLGTSAARSLVTDVEKLCDDYGAYEVEVLWKKAGLPMNQISVGTDVPALRVIRNFVNDQQIAVYCELNASLSEHVPQYPQVYARSEFFINPYSIFMDSLLNSAGASKDWKDWSFYITKPGSFDVNKYTAFNKRSVVDKNKTISIFDERFILYLFQKWVETMNEGMSKLDRLLEERDSFWSR